MLFIPGSLFLLINLIGLYNFFFFLSGHAQIKINYGKASIDAADPHEKRSLILLPKIHDMKNKKIFIVFILAFVCLFQSAAQQKKDVINLQPGTRIEQLNTSGKYFGLKTFNKQTRKNNAILYDTLGNKLIEFEDELRNEIMTRIENFLPNSKNDQAILINRKYDRSRHSQWITDEIIAYDIESKNILWKTNIIGGAYKKSPNGKYLLTTYSGYNSDPDLEGESKLSVIDLENGTILPFKDDFNQFKADWYDNERVIIATWDAELVKNEQIASAYKVYYDSLNSITSKLGRLNLDYRKGRIDKGPYEEKRQQLLHDLEKYNREERKKLTRKDMPMKTVVKDYKLIRYNILSGEIEHEKVFERRGILNVANIREFIVSKNPNTNKKSIFVNEGCDSRIHKLDDNFTIDWTAKINMPNKLYKVIDKNSELSLIVHETRADEYKIIEKEDGKIRLLPPDNNVITKNANRRYNKTHETIDLTMPIYYDEKNQQINLKVKKND